MPSADQIAGIIFEDIVSVAMALDRRQDDMRIDKGPVPGKIDDDAPNVKYRIIGGVKSGDAQSRHSSEGQGAKAENQNAEFGKIGERGGQYRIFLMTGADLIIKAATLRLLMLFRIPAP
jgi:hypothetical protein